MQLQMGRAVITDAGTTGRRWGKVPDEIANMEGLSFEATAIIARRCIFVGTWGTGYDGVASAFRPSRRTGKAGMHHETFRKAIAEIGSKGLWERTQRGRRYAKEKLSFEAKPSRYRRTEEEWLTGTTFCYRQYGLGTYIRANVKGVTPAQIDQRFGCSRPATNALVKELIAAGWLSNIGSKTAPRYVWIKPSAALSGTGTQTPNGTGTQTLNEMGRKLSCNPPRSKKTTKSAPRCSGPIRKRGLIEEPASKVPDVARQLIDKAHYLGLDVGELLRRLAKRVADTHLGPVQDIDAYFAESIEREIGARDIRCNAAPMQPAKQTRRASASPAASLAPYPSQRVTDRERRRPGASAYVDALLADWPAKVAGRAFATKAHVDMHFLAVLHARMTPPTPVPSLIAALEQPGSISA